jgi:hypothetical protein
MNRFIHRRLAGLEKEAATMVAASQYPPIPSLAEQKLMSLAELQELYNRVLRGEYSQRPGAEDRRMDPEGKTTEELADAYARLCHETAEEIGRVFGSRAAVAQADGEAG